MHNDLLLLKQTILNTLVFLSKRVKSLFNKQIKIRMDKKMKAPSWTNEEKLILLENVKTFDDIVNKKFSSTLTKEQKEKA